MNAQLKRWVSRGLGAGRGAMLAATVMTPLFTVPFTVAEAAIQGGPLAISVDSSSVMLSDDQQNPHIVEVSDKGLWFVIWEDWRNWRTTGADIYGRFINSDGTFCGSEIAVTTAAGHQTLPKVAYRDVLGTSGDKLLVVWQDSRTESFTYGYYSDPEDEASWASRTYEATNVRYKEITFSTQSSSCSSLNATVSSAEHSIGFNGTQYWENILIDSDITVDADLDGITDNDYSTFTAYTTNLNDELRSRQKPVVSYEPATDRFYLGWIESRNKLQHVSELAFGFAATTWYFGDEDSPGYMAVSGANVATQISNEIGESGPDIFRNITSLRQRGECDSRYDTAPVTIDPDCFAHDDDSGDVIRTVRLISSSHGALEEVFEYEYFTDINNIAVGSDTTSPESYFVWEGIARTATLTCACEDSNSNGYCDFGEGVSCGLETANLNDGNPHISGIPRGRIHLPANYAEWIDNGSDGAAGFYPSIGMDPVHRKYLVAWERGRDGENKVYGQLLHAGGGLYNSNFIISYSDSDDDGAQDPNVETTRQTRPAIGYDGSHQRFFVTWQDGRNTRTSLENLDIYGQFIDSEGSLRGENMPISVATGNQYNPVTAYNRDNHQFLTVWKDSRNANTDNGQDTFSDILGQRYSLGQPQLNMVNTDDTTLVPPLFDYGVLTVGQSASQTVKLVNSGDTYVNVDCVDPYPAPSPYNYAFAIPTELQTCDDGLTLALVPSSEYLLSLQFAPTTTGTYIESFTIESDAGSPTIFLQGIANSAVATTASIVTSPDSVVDCGTVGSAETRSVNLVISNTGNTDVTVTAMDLPTSGTPFSITGVGAGTVIGAKSTLYAVVQCNGAAAGGAGEFSSNLRMLFDAGVDEVELVLTATVSADAVVSSSSTSSGSGSSSSSGTTLSTWRVYDTWEGNEVAQSDLLVIGLADDSSAVGTWGAYQFPITYQEGVGWTWTFTNGTYTWYYTITSATSDVASGTWQYSSGGSVSQAYQTRAVRVE